MKSPRNLRTLLLWLTAAAVMTITFRMASTRTPVHQKPVRHSASFSRVEPEPSAQLLDAAMRKVDFPQMLNPIERAVLHQPLRMPSGNTILPDHSLLIEAIPVVEDSNLTWDPCLVTQTNNGGNKMGAWTFNELMLAVAGLPPNTQNPQPAENILTGVIADFDKTVTIGNYTAPQRTGGPDFFASWPRDANGLQCTNPFGPGTITCLALINAPVHLNAIVNRIDIGQNGKTSTAGMLRFVFGVTMNTTNGGSVPNPNGSGCQNSGNQNFNIILEYNVPSGISAQNWASQWEGLSSICPNGFTAADGCDVQGDFDPALNQIVQQVVAQNAGGSGAPNGSALADLRTNENELNGGDAFWELRQFSFASQSGTGVQLVESALTQTPDLSFDGAEEAGVEFCSISEQHPACNSNLSTVANVIQNNLVGITTGNFMVPQADQAVFAINATIYWDSLPSMGSNANLYYVDRAIFAGSPQFKNGKTGNADPQGGIDGTCNGCHGTETLTTFQQVANRASGTGSDAQSVLSPFLLGCNNNGATLTSACPANMEFLLTAPGCEKVQDPVFNGTNGPTSFANTFGDVLRRVNCMNTILNSQAGSDVQCNGAGLPPNTNGTCP